MHDHHRGIAALGLDALLPVLLVLAATGYLVLLARARRAGRSWPARRSGSFVMGATLTCWALLGPLRDAAHDHFAAHMAQHLLVGMMGPFLMALGAPVSLLLRWGPVRWRPGLTRVLHSRFTRLVTQPVLALVLSVGSLPLLYATNLYAAAATTPVVHAAVHLHFFAGGYLFAWVICGPDPAPARPSVPARLATLGVAVLVHATISQLMYAGLFPVGVDPVALRQGGSLMYYGGDLIELALAVVLVTQWRPERQRTPRRTLRGVT